MVDVYISSNMVSQVGNNIVRNKPKMKHKIISLSVHVQGEMITFIKSLL